MAPPTNSKSQHGERQQSSNAPKSNGGDSDDEPTEWVLSDLDKSYLKTSEKFAKDIIASAEKEDTSFVKAAEEEVDGVVSDAITKTTGGGRKRKQAEDLQYAKGKCSDIMIGSLIGMEYYKDKLKVEKTLTDNLQDENKKLKKAVQQFRKTESKGNLEKKTMEDQIEKLNQEAETRELVEAAHKFLIKSQYHRSLFLYYGFQLMPLRKDVKNMVKDSFLPDCQVAKDFFSDFFEDLQNDKGIISQLPKYNHLVSLPVKGGDKHYMDTDDYRQLLWWGKADSPKAADSIASTLVDKHNEERTEVVLYCIYPQILNILKDVPKKAEERSESQNIILQMLVRATDNPRDNLEDYAVFFNVFTVLALQMNDEDLRGGTSSKFIQANGKECQKSHVKKFGIRITGLSEAGKAKLHGKWLSKCLSPAQEAWIILHARKVYCGLFLEPEKDSRGKQIPGVRHIVVPNQGEKTGNGGPGSYQKRDVEFFNAALDKILEGREKDDKKPIKERFMYFDFPDAKDPDDAKKTSTARVSLQDLAHAAKPAAIDSDKLRKLKGWRKSS